MGSKKEGFISPGKVPLKGSADSRMAADVLELVSCGNSL